MATICFSVSGGSKWEFRGFLVSLTRYLLICIYTWRVKGIDSGETSNLEWKVATILFLGSGRDFYSIGFLGSHFQFSYSGVV